MLTLEACPACGTAASRSTRFGTFGRWPRHGGKDAPRWALDLSRCPCSHVYANPQPTWDELGPFYQADYHQYQEVPRSTGEIEEETRGFRGDRFRHARVTPGGRYLDIGCGLGDMVVAFGSLGMKAQGVEVSKAAVEIARRRGLDVYQGTLQDAGFPEETFDTVTLYHVLEHVHDPVDLLRAARRVLRRDGELLVVVPNIGSMMFAVLKDMWTNVDVPRHIHHFTPDSLRATAGRAGLRVADLGTEALDWAIEGELKYWLRYRFFIPGRFWNRTGLLKPLARRLASRANARGRGDVIIANLINNN
jgi:2-polyprenyl-3-methyl-5-hydroxy-6-metoxy-1,4-benzoquinol methylase